jgi:hypothetical protein
MMHRWNAKKNNSSAVSEILGTVLLLGISVTLFSVVYFSILTVPNTPPIPSANIICSIADGEFVFSHIGGSELSDETKILLTIPGETTTATIIAKDYMDASAKADGNWGVGEKVRYTYSSFVGREVDYSVVDIGSNAIVVTGFIPAIDPIRTFINDLLTCTGSSKTITASSTGTEPDNVTLWYKWDGYWEDTFENDDLVSSYHNMTFENGYAEVNKSGEGTDIIDYVDNQNVAVDGISDIGTHSDFANEKNGPDSNFDILEESSASSVIEIPADWGADVQDNGVKYVNDGNDAIGYYISWSESGKLRTANKFLLDDLPPGSTITKVEVIFTVLSSGKNTGNPDGRHKLDIYSYGSNGQSDPETDSGWDMYDR